jgi:hypothetical protein
VRHSLSNFNLLEGVKLRNNKFSQCEYGTAIFNNIAARGAVSSTQIASDSRRSSFDFIDFIVR